MYSRNHALLLVHEFGFMHDNRHRVNTRGHVLKGNIIFLKSLQYSPAKSDLGIHHGFGNLYDAESLLSRDAGNRVLWLFGRTLHDPGSLILGSVGISDINRDSL